jgi:hypothetical protein
VQAEIGRAGTVKDQKQTQWMNLTGTLRQMSKMKKLRARRVRHQANQACKFGKSAKPTHKRLGGRSGHSMRKDGKSV